MTISNNVSTWELFVCRKKILLTPICEHNCQTDQVRSAAIFRCLHMELISFMISDDNAGCLGLHLHLTHFWVDYWDWFRLKANWDVGAVNVTCGVYSWMTSFLKCLKLFVFHRKLQNHRNLLQRKIYFPFNNLLDSPIPPASCFQFWN